MKKISIIAFLCLIFLPVLVGAAATSSDDSQGLIDPGGIMTSKAAEEERVQAWIEQQHRQQQRIYWVRIAGLIVFSLGMFEIGVRLGRNQVLR